MHNNCSGKHSGMLATARALGVPTEGYLDFEHPVQRMIAQNLSLLSGVPEEQFKLGRDGCGAPTVAMPLAAWLYAGWFGVTGDAAGGDGAGVRAPRDARRPARRAA